MLSLSSSPTPPPLTLTICESRHRKSPTNNLPIRGICSYSKILSNSYNLNSIERIIKIVLKDIDIIPAGLVKLRSLVGELVMIILIMVWPTLSISIILIPGDI